MKRFIEFIFFIRIAASPAIIGGIISWIIWVQSDHVLIRFFSVFILVVGIVLGIFWANRIRKKENPSQFMSKINASPDFDLKEK